MKDQSITLPRAVAASTLPLPRSSFLYCRRVMKRARSSFPLAFRFLPPAKRHAMTVLYAYFRITDDLADSPGHPDAKRTALANWRTGLRFALAGHYSHRLHSALHHTVATFDVSPEMLEAVIDGAEADLEPVAYATFAELRNYCYRVASAVGIACVQVWGFRDFADRDEGFRLAEEAGIAFQLTNILRDLGEDRDHGRIYLPAEELARFDCPPERWEHPDSRENFREMMRFQVRRAREYYTRAEPLGDLLTPEGRTIFRAMSGLYRRLLDELEARDFDVFTRRVRLATHTKFRILAAAWLGR